MVNIEGIENVLQINSDIISGVTTLFAEGAIIENHALKIPDGAQLTLGSELGTSRQRNLVVTKDVTKTVLAVRVIANDSQPGSSATEIGDNVFGTGSDVVNLKSQMEGCSHGRLGIKAADASDVNQGGQYISQGVMEIHLDMDADGEVNGNIQDAAENALEVVFGTDDLSSIFNHVMLCLPPGTIDDDGSGWIGYGYYNGHITVYNDDWCNYPSIQMVRT